MRDIDRYKVKPNPSKRLLQNKLDKLLNEKAELFSKHCTYSAASKKALDSDELTNWITPHMDDATDLADEIYLKIDELDEEASVEQRTADDVAKQAAEANEISIIEKQCTADEKMVNDRVALMMTIVNDVTKNSVEDVTLVQAYLQQINESMEELSKSYDTLKSKSITAARLTELFTSQETIRKHIAANTAQAAIFIHKIVPSTNTNNTSTTIVSSNPSQLHLETTKAKNPVFNGDIRTYARFKSDFQNFVAPKYPSKLDQAYVMKQECLKGSALKYVASITDIDEIWERLDSRYGDEIEIVNTVIKGVQNFTFKGINVNSAMIKLVDELERGVMDLDAIHSKHHIANAITVKLIEEKLPTHIVTR